MDNTYTALTNKLNFNEGKIALRASIVTHQVVSNFSATRYSNHTRYDGLNHLTPSDFSQIYIYSINLNTTSKSRSIKKTDFRMYNNPKTKVQPKPLRILIPTSTISCLLNNTLAFSIDLLSFSAE